MKRQKFTISYFICPDCGNLMPLPRPQSRKRNKGHNKWLNCPFCNKKVNTTEVRSGDVYECDDGRIIYA